jgi:osmotically-inducible protein OsmY
VTVRKRASRFYLAVAISFGASVVLGACGSGVSDEVLRERIEAALASASDVPAGSIAVEVSDGVVTLTGSVVCQECGGSRTPPGFGTVQQSLGAVVRAIPGVESVEFRLEYEPLQDEGQ